MLLLQQDESLKVGCYSYSRNYVLYVGFMYYMQDLCIIWQDLCIICRIYVLYVGFLYTCRMSVYLQKTQPWLVGVPARAFFFGKKTFFREISYMGPHGPIWAHVGPYLIVGKTVPHIDPAHSKTQLHIDPAHRHLHMLMPGNSFSTTQYIYI